ncbi:AzlD domain-containing protein [Oceanobacillus profundus]|nr:AzlD domain-containing protein [Oceanobacillus profundus]MCM3400419.1 AzlD domain-containing protein [Oceanobacillus profundus]MDO6450923.1 AzlD domain-containing protein [Oceanobacillus profundus]
MNNWMLIALLTISTYLSRVIGVEIMAGREMNATLRLYFNYVPIAIIAALIANQMLVPTDGGIALSLPVLIGCLATAITLKVIHTFLPSLIIGIAAGLLARYFL